MKGRRSAGVDEAGRGPLAGPVFAAAVILDPERRITGLADSKTLEPERREELATAIKSRALAWSIGRAEVEEIDTINILQATLLAMQRAIAALTVLPDLVLVDGGAGQLAVAREVLAELGLSDIAVAGVAKGPDRDAGREHFHMPGRAPFICSANLGARASRKASCLSTRTWASLTLLRTRSPSRVVTSATTMSPGSAALPSSLGTTWP